jgi:hypothetical protein
MHMPTSPDFWVLTAVLTAGCRVNSGIGTVDHEEGVKACLENRGVEMKSYVGKALERTDCSRLKVI